MWLEISNRSPNNLSDKLNKYGRSGIGGRVVVLVTVHAQGTAVFANRTDQNQAGYQRQHYGRIYPSNRCSMP